MSDRPTKLEQSENLMSDGDTLPRLSTAERSLIASVLENASLDKFPCPKCLHLCRPGELACPECGALFASGGATNKIEARPSSNDAPKSWPLGQVFAEQTPVTLEIGGRKLTLPIADCLVIGRLSDVPGDPRPDVNLNAFGADACGVSRRHARITRQGGLIYVADLDSSNGTFLNDRKLQPHINRLVRDGDEVRLSHLTVQIRFRP